jgi:A/G-specific adenine glycosylase
MVVLEDAGQRILLRKRPSSGLWGGLWEPPWLELEGKMSQANALRYAKRWLEEMGWEVDSLAPVGELSHGLTHFQLQLQCFSARGMNRNGRGRLPAGLRWVEPGGVAALPMGRLGRRALEVAAARGKGDSQGAG